MGLNSISTEFSANKAKKILFVAAALAGLVTFLVYLPALRNGFVNWDDWEYIHNNQAIKTFDLDFIRLVFTTAMISNWHPLTMISHALDYALWGLNPVGHHLVNVILHSVDAFLVFILAVRLFGAAGAEGGKAGKKTLTAGLAAALLFGLHPLHVESVAWVSERKDVLSALFFVLSILSYLRYARSDKKAFHYISALVLFALALMSKPMAISLPLVLLILDFHPLGRLKAAGLKKAVVEKVPFFALGVLSGALTIWAQKGALVSTVKVELSLRALTALRAFAFYLYKMALPVDLAPYYPLFTEESAFKAEYAAAIAVLIAITVFSVLMVKRNRLFLAAWAYYVVTLVPVSGIVQVGGQAAADRYTYLPSLGPFLLAGAGVYFILKRFSGRTACAAVMASIAAVALMLSTLTIRQTAVWKDSVTLWSHEIEIYPIVFAYKNRGAVYYNNGRYKEAVEDFTFAIEGSSPENLANLYLRRGAAYQGMDEHLKAVSDFTESISLNGGAAALLKRGDSYRGIGQFDLAVADYDRLISMHPQLAEAYFNKGLAYAGAGKDELAALSMKKAADLGLEAAADYLRGRGY